MQPRQASLVSQVKPFIIGPRPKASAPQNKMKLSESHLQNESPPPEENPIVSNPTKNDDPLIEDMDEGATKTRVMHLVVSPEREPSNRSRRILSQPSPVASIGINHIYIPSESRNNDPGSKVSSQRNTFVPSAAVSFSGGANSSQVSEVVSAVKAKPQTIKKSKRRSGSVELGPDKSYMSRIIEKRYQEMMMLKTPKAKGNMMKDIKGIKEGVRESITENKEENGPAITKEAADAIKAAMTTNKETKKMAYRRPPRMALARNLRVSSVVVTSRPITKKLDEPNKLAIPIKGQVKVPVKAPVKAPVKVPIKVSVKVSVKPQAKSSVDTSSSVVTKEKQKEVVINLENLERIVGKKKLDQKGLKKKVIKKGEGTDPNACVLYLYLEYFDLIFSMRDNNNNANINTQCSVIMQQ